MCRTCKEVPHLKDCPRPHDQACIDQQQAGVLNCAGDNGPIQTSAGKSRGDAHKAQQPDPIVWAVPAQGQRDAIIDEQSPEHQQAQI